MYERDDFIDDESDRGGDRQAQIEHEREVPNDEDYAYVPHPGKHCDEDLHCDGRHP